MTKSAPSLVRRLALAFAFTQLFSLLLLHVVLWPIAIADGRDPTGPIMVLSYLQEDIVDKDGDLALKSGAEVLRLAERDRGLWFLVRGDGGELKHGPVPLTVSARGYLSEVNPVSTAEVRIENSADVISARTLHTAAGPVLAIAGGVDPRRVTFLEWLWFYYRDDRLWLPLLTALFTLAGAAVAVPIVMKSISPTVAAAAHIGPGAPQERLPAERVVRELLPMVNAFNRVLDRLAVAREAQRRFIADVAHELRTPLTILGMKVDGLPSGAAKVDVERLVYRLEQMVGQMLYAERQQFLPARQERLDLVELVKEAVGDVTPLALSNGYEVAFLSDVDALPLLAAPEALTRVVVNLVGNAIAHGGNKGTIEVRVLSPGVIEVADEGPGIPVEKRERIFEPFYRERWDRDGCGLGLHLVREIVHAHGGEVSVVDSPRGAIFRVSLETLA